MRIPPDLNGHGGSQRAWHLIDALRPHGQVHFVLVYRDCDKDCIDTDLTPLETVVASVTRIKIDGWAPIRDKLLGVFHPDIANICRMGSQEAPVLSRREVAGIAQRLPIHTPDMIFAGRLCSAVIVQSIIDSGQLSAPLRLVDFDDIMSKFRARQIRAEGPLMGRQWRALAPVDMRLIARAERRIVRSWHGISVCTAEDVASLRADHPGTAILQVPNVLDRAYLKPRQRTDGVQLLFVGNLGFGPNVSGLMAFIEHAWGRLQDALPGVRLTVVGMNPTAELRAFTERHGLELHANVPDLQPYYAGCDAVLAPILFGSGTRIKIIEAMAYGRPIVSTALGAEGLGLESGNQMLLADTMDDFADAVIRLGRDPAFAGQLATRARAFQQARYRPAAIQAAMSALIQQSQSGFAIPVLRAA